MASSTMTLNPIHPDNLALAKELESKFGANNRFRGKEYLRFVSAYAPLESMTYGNHVLYSVLGHPANGIPIPAATAANGKFIASDGVALEAIDSKGSYQIIGTKLNGTQEPLPADNSLTCGLPPFPSVQLSPQSLGMVDWWRGEQDLLSFDNCKAGIMPQMCDYRMDETGQMQILIHPNAVVYQARELLTRPLKSDDPDVQATTLSKLKQIYTCAVAIVFAVQDNDNDSDQDRLTTLFRSVMKRKYINVVSVDKNVIKGIAPPSIVKRDAAAHDGMGIESDLWFFNQLLNDWAVMICMILIAARSSLDEAFEFKLDWDMNE